MWDGGLNRVCGGDFSEIWERTREEKKDMIVDHNLNLGFTAYDSVNGDQNQYPKQIASFFLSKSFNNF